MPTFKFEEMDDSLTYGGDNDMYFRQWRMPSMKPVLDEKLDRDFQKSVDKKEDFLAKREEAKRKHDEKFKKKLQDLEKQMAGIKVSDTKENRQIFRKPTQEEVKKCKERLNREFESPSSTASMKPAGKLKPRQAPLFGSNMAGLKNIVLPPPSTSSTPSIFGNLPRKSTISESSTGTGTPKDNSFLNSSHETVFYPQNHSSFNLDHYNGTRPSFAFAGLNAATSTPVSKNPTKFLFNGSKIAEEGDDSVFEDTKYVTAMESPILKTSAMAEEIQKQKAREEEIQMQKKKELELQRQIDEEKRVQKQEEQKLELQKRMAQELQLQKRKAEEEELQKQKLKEMELQKRMAQELELQKREEELQKQHAKKLELQKLMAQELELQKLRDEEEELRERKLKELELQKQNERKLELQKRMAQELELQKLRDEEEELQKQNAQRLELQKLRDEEEELQKRNLKEMELQKQNERKSELQKPMAQELELQTQMAQEWEPQKLKAGEEELQKRMTQEWVLQTLETGGKEAEEPRKKFYTPPYFLFQNYIKLQEKILEEKSHYEKTADGQERALLKRTITEKVTVFTRRQTDDVMRQEILEFFKSLLKKMEVKGFSIGTNGPILQLRDDADVNYAIYCIVEKYMSLAEHDDELATTISDLISRLSLVSARVERVFFVMMLNKSVLLRQEPKECVAHFVENRLESDEKAILVNRENALVTLFLHVFVKNAVISRRRKMVLNEELLWKFAEVTVDYAPKVPKASMVILLLITCCKPGLCADSNRWNDFLSKIELETIPMLENDPFPGDESVIAQLKRIMTVFR